MSTQANAKLTFAVFLGNRGFFPASLMDAAREDVPKALSQWGYDAIMMDRDATRHGAVETVAEGRAFAQWLKENEDKVDGVIVCLPNFGDETGAVTALQDATVPILIQAYPDDMDKMAPALRRDAFCGKFSIMDMFCQYGIKFTAMKPHTVDPTSARFKENVDEFAAICRVVNGMKRFTVGAIGARTTAFKTVRIDELTLQRAGITMETLDLSHVFSRVNDMQPEGEAYEEAKARLHAGACWQGVPEEAQQKLIKLSVVIDELIAEFDMDALAIRCWIEMQQIMGISPCVLLSDLNDRGMAAACEVDVGNAVTMHALRLASQAPAMCLDWNNNYADDDDKCILFHCGPVAFSLMQGKGDVVDHAILANAVGEGCGYGPNVGRIRPMPMTFGSLLTENGKLKFYLGEAEFTDDPIPAEFFGCAGVAAFDGLQDVLLHVGRNGYRHHVSVAPGHYLKPVYEALTNYLGWDVAVPQKEIG